MRIIRETLDKIDEFEFECLKQEVADLTDSNYHTEALLKIAEYYNLDEFIPYLKELSEYQNSEDYAGLTLEQTKERLDVMHKIFDVLKDKIGEDKANELFSSL